MTFVLGQKVTVTDDGLVYAFCDPAAEQFGLKRYIPGQGLATQKNATGVVVAEPTFFPDGDCTLMGLSLDAGFDVVIAVEGVSTDE